METLSAPRRDCAEMQWRRGRAGAAEKGGQMMRVMEKKQVLLLISTLFGIALLGIMIWLARPMAILARIKALGAGGISAFVISVVVGFSFGVEGWRRLLRDYGLNYSFRRTFGMMAGAYAVTYLTPSFYLGGEPVRAFAASDGFTRRTHEVVATIFIERLIYLIVIASFLLAGGIIGLESSSISGGLQQGIVGLAGTALVVSGIALVGMSRRATWASRFFTAVLRHLPQWKWVKRMQDGLVSVEAEVNAALNDHRWATLHAAALFALSVGMNVVSPLIFFFFAYGRILPADQLVLFFALSVVLSVFTWITPGGIGVTEGGYAAVFAIMGLPIDGAVAFSLMQKLASMCIVGVGMGYLAHHGIDYFGRRKSTRKRIDQREGMT